METEIDEGIPTANDLRPLCPLDCLRKLWERLIMRRITLVWNEHNILNEAQHCTPGRGYSAALLHFQVELDMAQESGTYLHVIVGHQESL